MGCGGAHEDPLPPKVTDDQNTMNASATSATAMRRARGVPQRLSQTARPLSHGKNATHTTGFATSGSPRNADPRPVKHDRPRGERPAEHDPEARADDDEEIGAHVRSTSFGKNRDSCATGRPAAPMNSATARRAPASSWVSVSATADRDERAPGIRSAIARESL